MNNYETEAQRLELPSAPKQFLHYFEEENRPQTKLDRTLETAWPFRSAVCVKTRSIRSNSSVSRTTPSAALPAVRF